MQKLNSATSRMRLEGVQLEVKLAAQPDISARSDGVLGWSGVPEIQPDEHARVWKGIASGADEGPLSD